MNIPDPKFDIGDFVYLKQDIMNKSGEKYSSKLSKFQIIGRDWEECIAGIQLKYKLRGMMTAGDRVYDSIVRQEFELTNEGLKDDN